MSRLSKAIRRFLTGRRGPVLESLGPAFTELAAMRGQLGDIDTIVHVGAHIAQERKFYEDAIGARRVDWIEGSGRLHARLKRLLDQETRTGFLKSEHNAIQALISDTIGQTVELHWFDDGGGANSIFPPTDEFRREWPSIRPTDDNEQLETRTLDSLLDAGQIGRPDLLVLDIQGAELPALRGGTTLLSYAKAVIAEVSQRDFYCGGTRFEDLEAHLRHEGLERIRDEQPQDMEDVLYVRRHGSSGS